MTRREKIFWLAIGAIMLIGFLCLIPAHGEICKEAGKSGEEHCTAYRLPPFVIIWIGKILDAMGGGITALATIAIAWFTLTLRKSTDKLWEAGEKQIKLAREGFISTHRPRLIVRRVSLQETKPRGGITTPLLQVQYVIANVGANRAYVIDNYADLYFVEDKEELPALPPFEGEKNKVGPLEFGNGDSKPIIFNTSEKGWKFLQDQLGHGKRLYFVGYIQYRDGLGNIRRTAFCRRYNGNTKRFSAIDDPDYEYVD